MNIGLELKNLRKKSKLTQLELAQKCNLSKNAIWNYENNKRDPTRATLTKIGEALGVDLGYLISKPITISSKTAQEFNEMGLASDVISDVNTDKDYSLIEFTRFLAAAHFPYDIPIEEIEIILQKTKDFLNFEFYKLGYIRVTDKSEDENHIDFSSDK